MDTHNDPCLANNFASHEQRPSLGEHDLHAVHG